MQKREFIFSKAYHIWQVTGIRIEEDFAPEIDEQRKDLKPIFHAARKIKEERGNSKYKVSMVLAKN